MMGETEVTPDSDATTRVTPLIRTSRLEPTDKALGDTPPPDGSILRETVR
jgi:hypothetical protein